MTIVTARQGTRSMELGLTGDTYPEPPRISNYSEAQAIDAAQDFGLAWDPMTGGTEKPGTIDPLHIVSVEEKPAKR